MMSDVIERLRAANPVSDCPAPPIEAVWRRLEADSGDRVDRAAASAREPRPRLRRVGSVLAVMVSVAAVAISAAAIALVGHGRPETTSPTRVVPSRLAVLHAQAGELLGARPGLAARVHALRGLPIVINVWASWCTPCREQFRRMASASARNGRQVAFLGADFQDTARSARAFLRHRRVGYPSYRATRQQPVEPTRRLGRRTDDNLH